MTTTAVPSASAWSALRHRDFRWMFWAQFLSTIGSFMQNAAINWHVYDLTGSMTALGLVGLVRIVPIIVLSLLGGVIADAIDRRKLMLFTQTGMLIAAGALALLTITQGVSLPALYGLTAVLAGLSAFDRPAWSALLPNLVPKAEISSAVKLNVVLIQITSVVGPMLAGLALGAAGAGAAYAVNAISFAPVVLALWLIHVAPVAAQNKGEISVQAMFEGLRFVRSQPLLWSSMILDFFATFFASALALLPVYAADILRVGEVGYGVLAAAPAIGATIGALAMAQYGGRFKQQGWLLIGAVIGYGATTVIFGLSATFWISLLALAASGFMDAISTVIRNAIRQLLTPDHLRGRMLSVSMIFYLGGPQLGEFEAGLVAQAFGPAFSVISGGIGTIVVTVLLAFRVPVLRTYRESVETAPPAAEALPTAEAVPAVKPQGAD